MSFPLVELSALVDAKSGFASGENVEVGVVQVRMNNIAVDGALDWSKIRRVPAPKKGLSGLLAEAGDVLFNATNSPDLVGKSAHFESFDEAVTFSNHFLRLRPRANLFGRYLAYWLQAQWRAGVFRGMCRAWVNQASVSKDQLLALHIPLPPLDEQRRIAAILDQADALRRKRREVLENLGKLSRAVFEDLMRERENGPTQFRNMQLGKVASFYSGNSLPDGVHFAKNENGHLLLKVSDLNLPENSRKISASQSWSPTPGSKAGTCPPMSVVFPKRGGAIGTNKKRILVRSGILDPNLMGVHPDPSILTIEFLFGWFEAMNLTEIASGSTVPQLNKQDLAPLQIWIPTLQRQQDYGRHIRAIEIAEVKAHSALSIADTLFASLQHRAFRGEL